jgi:hypothetical protein
MQNAHISTHTHTNHNTTHTRKYDKTHTHINTHTYQHIHTLDQVSSVRLLVDLLFLPADTISVVCVCLSHVYTHSCNRVFNTHTITHTHTHIRRRTSPWRRFRCSGERSAQTWIFLEPSKSRAWACAQQSSGVKCAFTCVCVCVYPSVSVCLFALHNIFCHTHHTHTTLYTHTYTHQHCIHTRPSP